MYIIFHYKKSTHIWISPNASRLCSISIIIFLFSFQALRQTRQQRRHLRISQNLHQKFRIHTFLMMKDCFFHVRFSSFTIFSISVAREYSISSGSSYPKLIVRLPCGSASIRRTFFPSCANPIPKFTHDTVFPTPPF